jgi:hypothetical protein
MRAGGRDGRRYAGDGRRARAKSRPIAGGTKTRETRDAAGPRKARGMMDASARGGGKDEGRTFPSRAMGEGATMGCEKYGVVRPRAVKSELPRGGVKSFLKICTAVRRSASVRVHMKSLHLRRIHATDATT